MTIDWTKPLQTRDGRKARVVATDIATKDEYTHAALVMDEDGDESLETYTKEGLWWVSGGLQDKDLVNAPEKRSVWINAYDNGKLGYEFSSREEADATNKDIGRRTGILQVVFVDKKLVRAIVHDPHEDC